MPKINFFGVLAFYLLGLSKGSTTTPPQTSAIISGKVTNGDETTVPSTTSQQNSISISTKVEKNNETTTSTRKGTNFDDYHELSFDGRMGILAAVIVLAGLMFFMIWVIHASRRYCLLKELEQQQKQKEEKEEEQWHSDGDSKENSIDNNNNLNAATLKEFESRDLEEQPCPQKEETISPKATGAPNQRAGHGSGFPQKASSQSAHAMPADSGSASATQTTKVDTGSKKPRGSKVVPLTEENHTYTPTAGNHPSSVPSSTENNSKGADSPKNNKYTRRRTTASRISRKTAFNKGDQDIDTSGDGSSLQKPTNKSPRRRKSAQKPRRRSVSRKAKAPEENTI